MTMRVFWVLIIYIGMSHLQAQSHYSLEKTLAMYPVHSKDIKSVNEQKLSDNIKEYQGLSQKMFTGLFYFYKSFLSSQDINTCNFHPSCSEFGLSAIHKKGLVKGSILTFDRMTRCNGFALKRYEYDPKSKRFLDPIQ